MLLCRSLLGLHRRPPCVHSLKMASAGNWSLQIPGFNLPLNHAPQKTVLGRFMGGFPNALDPEDIESGSLNRLLTQREITMLQIMNAITEKPEWEHKVFDAVITTKWREEIAQSGQDVTPKMTDWIIKELQWKAGIFAQTGFVEAFDGGVIKSDTAISKELQHALKEAVLPFEDVPEGEKDYHPGSEGKVVDLVHPSLFPVVFGRTRVVADQTIGLEDCLHSMGEGRVLPVPVEDEASSESRGSHARPLHPAVLSTKFQWLPCDVKIHEDGKCQILSYINNAHPIKHRALYEVVEKILERTIPIWEHSLIWKRWGDQRISFAKVEYEDDGSTEPEYPEEESDAYDVYDEYEERMSDWYKSRKIIKPEPGDFKVIEERDKPRFVEDFAEGKLQVIVKLANIELTPEKPEYDGGSWHIEGQLNERIAASAIYYYDTENITPSSLAFRHRGMDDLAGVSYEQDRHEFMQQVYGYQEDLDTHNDDVITQELGGVVSKEGRLVSFPNTLQHRVSPFSLADLSKPGHRKILALFLVDPHVRIPSSANVPPQREDWWPEGQDLLDGNGVGLMTMEEAKAYRIELMEERGLRSKESNAVFQMGNFSLCEH